MSLSRLASQAQSKLAYYLTTPEGQQELRNRASEFGEGLGYLPERIAGAPVDFLSAVARGPMGVVDDLTRPGGPVKVPLGSEWLLDRTRGSDRRLSGLGMAGDILGQVAIPGPGEAVNAMNAATVGRVIAGGLADAEQVAARQIFAGKAAANADLDRMARAEARLDAGDDPAKVWAEEGWFRGPDGKMRWEIDDSGATLHWSGINKVDPDVEDLHFYGSVGSAVNHPQLTSAYPDLDEIPIIAYEEMAGRGAYHYQPWEQIDVKGSAGSTERNRLIDMRNTLERFIAENPGDQDLTEAAASQLADIESRLARGTYGSRETEAVMHELQHAVQGREGFARGGNFESLGRDAYRRLAGEAEARAVQARLNLTPEQRRARYPLKDYDVPVNDLIIRGQSNGPQMSQPVNRLDSLGRPVHHTPEGVENFGSWFANSGAADDAGNPLVLYSGTESPDFAAFSTSAASRPGVAGWMSPDPNVANRFARGSYGEPARVMPLYASFQNPYKTDNINFDAQRLASEGYDSVIVTDKAGRPVSYVAFEPQQMKSAIGNSGAYSRSNMDMAGSIDPQLAAILGLGAVGGLGAYTYANQRD